MCVICNDLNDEWSVEHMEQLIKSLKKEEILANAQKLKKMLAIISGIPENLIANETEQIKQAQYLLSRYM